MNLYPHIANGAQGMIDRINTLSKTPNENDLAVGMMAGLSGAIDGKRYLKIDRRNDEGNRHYRSRMAVEAFLSKYDWRQAKSWTRLSAAIVCALYAENRLTKTLNPAKHEKPDNPVALLNDASTGGNDIDSAIIVRPA